MYFRRTARSPAGPTSPRTRTGKASRICLRAFTSRERSLERDLRRSRTGGDGSTLIRGREDELDVELVDRYGLDGIGYTSQSAEAVAAVDRGDADVAFLLRAAACRRRLRGCAIRGADAAQEHVLLPEAAVRAPLPPSRLVTDWLATCRLCVADIREVLERLPTRVEREPVLRLGHGGDDTTAIDQAAEDAVVERLAALEEDFVLVSEELGERTFGAGGARRVVVDPIDGSVNAKRGIPFFSFSLAVAEGPTMGDVVFGYVYDFGTGEEWTAERGRARFSRGSRSGRSCPRIASRSSPSRGRPLPP